jgi:hypothetical protein
LSPCMSRSDAIFVQLTHDEGIISVVLIIVYLLYGSV